MSTLSLPAPAKLNLFLHIIERRTDGYHLLQSVFQLLDYGDTIHFELRKDNKIRRLSDLKNVPEVDDLTVKAAKLLQQYTQVNKGVNLWIDKKLPMGGGLGGGSSDAATVLQGLNTLWQCGLNNDELANLGIQLGADVPIFVKGKTAWAEGIGEIITPIEIKKQWYLIVHPAVHISTVALFSNKSLTRDCEPITISRFLAARESEEIQNVFEKLVKNIYPEVKAALDYLQLHCVNNTRPRLTGTGSCVFLNFSSYKEAKKIQQKLPKQWQTFIAEGINTSSMKKVLDKCHTFP